MVAQSFSRCFACPPWNRQGGIERPLKVLRACTVLVRLSPGGVVGCGHHLLPAALPVLVPLVTVILGRGRVAIAVSITEVTAALTLPLKLA
jgi:hypothetical protein